MLIETGNLTKLNHLIMYLKGLTFEKRILDKKVGNIKYSCIVLYHEQVTNWHKLN